jgi:hypothetical protein
MVKTFSEFQAANFKPGRRICQLMWKKMSQRRREVKRPFVNQDWQIPANNSVVFPSAFTCTLFSSVYSILRMSILIKDSAICYVNSVVSYRADEHSRRERVVLRDLRALALNLLPPHFYIYRGRPIYRSLHWLMHGKMVTARWWFSKMQYGSKSLRYLQVTCLLTIMKHYQLQSVAINR